MSESEDNLEVKSEENDIASANSDVVSNEDDEFITKSGRVWRNSVPPATRRRQCNVVRESPGPTRATHLATTMYQIFNFSFDNEIVETISILTNAEVHMFFSN